MKNPYLDWLQEHDRHQLHGAVLPLGGFDAPARPALDGSAPSVMIFAPHPDDECVIGGLALRIMRERGARVINVAVTLGSRKDRQAARRNELAAACAYLGFELVHTGEHGLEDVHPAARASDPRAWAAKVTCVRDILLAHRPGIIIIPHAADWNRTHLGTHALVMDAIAAFDGFRCAVIETEFWGAMTTPNLMLEISTPDLADLMAALSFHAGEVKRNPYHLRLPAWMQDNVRRGGEVVGGQGGTAPGFGYATLYRILRWDGKSASTWFGGGRIVGANEDIMHVFTGAEPWK
jgi:LmbE family N-acetylglucosaminyl deacetylase